MSESNNRLEMFPLERVATATNAPDNSMYIQDGIREAESFANSMGSFAAHGYAAEDLSGRPAVAVTPEAPLTRQPEASVALPPRVFMADAPRVLTLTGGRNGAPIQVTGDVLSDDHDAERHIANDRHPEIPFAFDWAHDIVSEWRREVTDGRTATLDEEQDQGVYANTVLQGSTQL